MVITDSGARITDIYLNNHTKKIFFTQNRVILNVTFYNSTSPNL